MTRPRGIGGADRVDPQLLAKFASKIRVSTHGTEATEAEPWPSAILPGVDRELYRRRQRRRALIGWATFGLLVAAIALAAIFGGEEQQTSTTQVDLFSSRMTSEQYEGIHKGQAESQVLNRIGSVGLREDEIEGSSLIGLFPARPDHSTCSYWTLSDAPDHLVRLCFSDPQGVLLQKSVAAGGGGDSAPTTLA